MARIIAKNPKYTGISASVPFINGEGSTGDPHLIEWFKDHGYTVEEQEGQGGQAEGSQEGQGGQAEGSQEGTEQKLADLTVDKLKEIAAEKNVEGFKSMKKDELIAAIESADALS